ncbi:putative tetratricopeptide-like helical domain-containing protein [Tanacetum coccineum]
MEIGSCCKPLAEHYNPIIDSLRKDKMVDQVLELFAKMIEKGTFVPIALKILLKIQALRLSMMSLWSQLSPQRYSQSSEVVKWFLREVAPKAGVELPKADDDEAPKNVDPIGDEYVLRDCDSPPIEEWHSDLKADTYVDFLMVTNWVKHNSVEPSFLLMLLHKMTVWLGLLSNQLLQLIKVNGLKLHVAETGFQSSSNGDIPSWIPEDTIHMAATNDTSSKSGI